MNDNLLRKYINLREEFDSILYDIDIIDVRNEWSYWYKNDKYTYDYYKMILDCEYYDAGFMSKKQHESLTNILEELYFLKEDDYLFALSRNNKNEDLINRIEKAPSLIDQFIQIFNSIYKQ